MASGSSTVTGWAPRDSLSHLETGSTLKQDWNFQKKPDSALVGIHSTSTSW